MTSLRVGLVGTGPHAAEVTVPTLMSTPGVTLAAICSQDASAQELAGAWGVEGVQATIEEFVKVGEFDAVVLASTPDDHETALALAARHLAADVPRDAAGVQRPAAPPLRRGQRQRDKPVPSFVGFNLRYAAMSRVALDLIAAHGRIIHVAMDCHAGEPRGGAVGTRPARQLPARHRASTRSA